MYGNDTVRTPVPYGLKRTKLGLKFRILVCLAHVNHLMSEFEAD